MDYMLESICLMHEISDMNISDYCESQFDKFAIELNTYDTFNESVMTEGVIELGKKVAGAIKNLIVNIGKFISELVTGVINTVAGFFGKAKGEKNIPNTKINVPRAKKDLSVLNEYIKQATKIERQILNVKTAIKTTKHAGKVTLMSDELAKLEKELNELNEKYDKVIKDNEVIVQVGLADAIRFGDKQLSKIRFDIKAIESDSKRVLAMFADDAGKADDPIKIRLIQKISMDLSARVRKYTQKYVESSKKSVPAIRTALVAAGVTAYVGYKTNPGAVKKVKAQFNKMGDDIARAKSKAKAWTEIKGERAIVQFGNDNVNALDAMIKTLKPGTLIDEKSMAQYLNNDNLHKLVSDFLYVIRRNRIFAGTEDDIPEDER